MKNVILLAYICFISINAFCQGFNHTFLIGYAASMNKARINFDTNSVAVVGEVREMSFFITQGNISDKNGNLLMASNGCWIANGLGDTMLNGANINPGFFTSDNCAPTSGLPLIHGNLFVPSPGDTNSYILLHQTGNYDAGLSSTELYFSKIDMSLDSNKGGVFQKNSIILQDTLSWGIAACRHANGRDWWIVALRDNSNIILKLLCTPSGIALVGSQALGVPFAYSNACQPTFSPDGNKFAYTYTYSGATPLHDVRLFQFDRCTGNFSDTTYLVFNDGSAGFGLAFSPNSKYLYFSNFQKIYQINTDTIDIAASLEIVAINDTFYSPSPPFQTDFYLMYLAGDGTIYISSGNGVLDLHYINLPDSGGISCDVHQHDLPLPCFSARGNVNHPNYYLGPVVGSVCDSLVHVGINEANGHDFHFSVSPNPITAGYMKIVYLLAQNKSGLLEVFDINGRVVYKIPLPPWSTLQQVRLPQLANGIYNAVITSGEQRTGRKIAITDLND